MHATTVAVDLAKQLNRPWPLLGSHGNNRNNRENSQGPTTIFWPATPPATLVTLHMLSASATPATTSQDISPKG